MTYTSQAYDRTVFVLCEFCPCLPSSFSQEMVTFSFAIIVESTDIMMTGGTVQDKECMKAVQSMLPSACKLACILC